MFSSCSVLLSSFVLVFSCSCFLFYYFEVRFCFLIVKWHLFSFEWKLGFQMSFISLGFPQCPGLKHQTFDEKSRPWTFGRAERGRLLNESNAFWAPCFSHQARLGCS